MVEHGFGKKQYGAISAGGDSPERQSQVMDRMTILENTTDALDDAFSALYNRLHTVLRSVHPSPESDREKMVPEEIVPLADYLRNQNEKIMQVVLRINDTIDRIEL